VVVVTDFKQEIREFLEGYVAGEDFEDSDDVFSLGLVSSLMAMQLVLFVEQQLGVRLDNDDLDFENFRSVDLVSHFMMSKMNKE
jgi:methoxymalonate biosynthesis acyl carrier protein